MDKSSKICDTSCGRCIELSLAYVNVVVVVGHMNGIKMCNRADSCREFRVDLECHRSYVYPRINFFLIYITSASIVVSKPYDT